MHVTAGRIATAIVKCKIQLKVRHSIGELHLYDAKQKWPLMGYPKWLADTLSGTFSNHVIAKKMEFWNWKKCWWGWIIKQWYQNIFSNVTSWTWFKKITKTSRMNIYLRWTAHKFVKHHRIVQELRQFLKL